MLTFSKDKKVVDILRGDIERADPGTLFFNNSFPEFRTCFFSFWHFAVFLTRL